MSLFSQSALQEAWPDIYCTRCNLRPIKDIYIVREYIVCPNCGDANHCILPVERVVGIFEGETRFDETAWIYYLRVWDEEKKEALMADLDELFITPGNYNPDWTIAEWVDSWMTDPVTRDKKIRVNIAPNIPLSPNARALLKQVALPD